MIRVLRVGIMAAAILITVLALFGIRDFSRSPYTGILHHNLVIQGLDKVTPNKDLDLKPGDKILAVDGEVSRNLNHFKYLIYSNTDLRPQIYRISRGDSIFEVNVKSIRQPDNRFYWKFGLLLVGFMFVLVGFIVILKRPDILGILFTVTCILFSFLVTERPATSINFLHIAGELVYDFLFIFLPAFFLHFFLLFPGKEIERGTLRSRAIRVLYVPPSIIFLSIFVLALVYYSIGIQHGIINMLEALIAIYWVVFILGSLITFIRTYSTSEKVQRIKFRIVIFGVALGVIPMSAVMLIKQFQPTLDIPNHYRYISVLFLSFIPTSFAYAILKHGAFDLGVVLRKVLAFAILAGLLVSLYYVLVDVLGERFGTLLGIQSSFVTAIAIVLLALAFVSVRAGIQRLVDRLFYRGRKVFREQVIEFTRKIQFQLSLPEVSSFVMGEMMELFNAEYVHIFLKGEGGKYRLRQESRGTAKIPLTSFPPDTELIRLIMNNRLPLMVEYFDKLWIKNNLDRISNELISISRVAVVVPLIEQRELFGFILVGRKRSGKPYTHSDAEILELLGERSAVALRNIELYGDSIEKGKLEEELHLASKIQARLLPEHPPPLKNAVLMGGLKTSREVGGDFYDFVNFEQGNIGIAVADVSGKGIPASILMTTLQAYFRAEAVKDRSPGEVLSALNDSLFERSDTERFATFFYATYDDDRGILHYSNGGSYPPFVFSRDGTLSRLQRGGVLIGVEADSKYKEGIIKLKPEDLVVIYTDGFIDQENEKRKPFGEKRLIEFFRNNSHLSIESMIEKLFATLIAFGNNNLKDDMTVVLLRKNPT